MQKGTPNLFLTAFLFKFQDLFHSLIWGSFQSFPHGTLHYRLIKLYLSLESGLPFFKQNFTGFVLLFFFALLRYNTSLFNFSFYFFSQQIFIGLFCFRYTTTYKIFVNFFSFCS